MFAHQQIRPAPAANGVGRRRELDQDMPEISCLLDQCRELRLFACGGRAGWLAGERFRDKPRIGFRAFFRADRILRVPGFFKVSAQRLLADDEVPH